MNQRIPRITGRKLIAALFRAGFFEHHKTGGHAILRHKSDMAKRVSVPIHSRDLKIGTLHGILKQSGLSPEELTDLL